MLHHIHSICTQPHAKTKPTDKAIKLGTLLYAIMVVLLGLVIAGFVGGYYQLAILAIFLIITGWLGVKDKTCYDIEQILCVTFFSGYIWVYTAVDLILKLFANGEDVAIAALVSLFGGVVFYLMACIVAKLLYDELRSNYNQVIQPGGGGWWNPMGRRQAQAQRVPDNEMSAEEVPCMLST